MIKPDAAAKQLEKWDLVEDDDFPLQHLSAQLKKLPKKLRDICYGLHKCNLSGEVDWEEETDEFAKRQQAAFKKLTKADRKKILQTLLGNLSTDVETTFQWLAKKEQSHGHAVPPFRGARSKHSIDDFQLDFLSTMLDVSRYDPKQLNTSWLAAWAPYVSSWGRFDEAFGFLFAAVIDKGGKAGDEVFDILCQSARKEHEIGAMGAHVSNALLQCRREAGWELMEKMLLAAQRQEGLRQVLLESTRFAHPDAFQRMLRLIVDNDLTRFSSVVAEMNLLFGTMWSAKGSRKIQGMLEIVLECLNSGTAARKLLAGDDPETAFFALWAIAFDDDTAAVKAAEKLAKHDQPEFRYIAAVHLTNNKQAKAEALRIKLADDEDLRVALTALNADAHPYYGHDIDENEKASPSDAKWFGRVEQLLERMPAKPKKLKPIVWPWVEITADRNIVAWQLIAHLGNQSPMQLLPHVGAFDKRGRVQIAQMIVAQVKWDKRTRDVVLGFAGDAAADVREAALDALKQKKINREEAERLEAYLTRTATDLRNRVVKILQSLSDKDALASAERLLQRTKNQRLASLELLRQLCDADRVRDECVQIAKAFQESQRKVLKDEQVQLDAILASDGEKLSLENCLGLMELSGRSPVTPPKKQKVQAVTSATLKLVKALDDWVHANRKRELTYLAYGHRYTTEVLGAIEYGFPSPYWHEPLKKELDKLPIVDDLKQWYESLPASHKDKDGYGLLRAYVWCKIATDYDVDSFRSWGKDKAKKPIVEFVLGKTKPPKLRYDYIEDLLQWLLRSYLPKDAVSFGYQVAETIYAMLPQAELEKLLPSDDEDEDDDYWSQWRNIDGVNDWREIADCIRRCPDVKPDKQTEAKRWDLLHWIDEPIPGASRERPDIDELAQAYLNKRANLADVYDHLIGPRASDDGWRGGFSSLNQMTERVLPKTLRKFAEQKPIAKAVKDITETLLEIELARGEAKTPGSSAALAVATYRGADTLARLLIAMGKKGFKKHNSWKTTVADSRQCTFTELVTNTHPAADDTHASFSKLIKQAIKDAHFPEERLLQLAFLAPQWTGFIEHTLKWDGFAEALYWFVAHMKYVWGMDDAFASDEDLEEEAASDDDDDEDDDKPEKLSRWERIIRERTPLTGVQRSDGAIDVAWFRRTHKQLGAARWEAMSTAAKYAANSAQAKRAQFIADVLMGKATKKELVEGITKRNLKENVRLLGLLPLPSAASKTEKDIQDRYEVLQSYLRYANKLSSMSRPEALRAYEIGMQNLASTAGYADPMRLQWALEAASTKDLAKGPIVVKKGDVSLTLELDEHAQPSLTIQRGEKELKSLPKAVNKDSKFVDLRDRNKHLKRQASRVKQSLENAMCRGDSFTGGELMQLSDHAILWPQLERIVLIGEGILGYPDKRGKALRDHADKLEPVKKSEELRIAHPFDLLKTKQWSKWQRECFAVERLQPFKQMFRELYVVTAQEKKDKTQSNRYAGQQVNPRQAHALWGRRGWSVDEDENVWKAFHDEGIHVSVHFNYGYTTPLEVEGLTIDKIEFTRSNEFEPMKLTDVPPRLFSEVMRDMDLVVSVAHVGDVDPEASASTVEMRSALLSETCKLLSLKNVKLKTNHAVIKGSLSDYTVHLGSGVVHRMPGGSVCLVAVHSQHRGRLFLPFADDDPRTAEVIAKTLMLARDDEIDDPILLQQIRDV